MNAIKLGVLLAGILFLITACQQPASNSANTSGSINSRPGETAKPAATVDVIAEAKEVYATNCMICHKENGTGGPVTVDGKKLKPDNLTSDKIKLMTDEKLIGYVTNGVIDEGMPAFKGKLSEDEIKLAVAHVRRLQGP